ncbi:putative calpain cysteine peptidase, partial [Trypanosoma rangeli]
RRRTRQLKYSSNVKDVQHTEEEMAKRVEELALTAKLVKAHRMRANEHVRARNPFLVYEDRKCVPLSEIPLAGDVMYQGLFREHLAALTDAETNAAQIAGLEGALRSRADELALGECEKELQLAMYPFLATHDVPGWSDALLRDVEFQQLRNRYDELSKDPQGNAEALRELEDAMDARGRAVAEALHAAEASEAAEQARLQTLFPLRLEVPVTVEADNGLSRLLRRRSSMLGAASDVSRSVASTDKNSLRRVSLLPVSLDENKIEVCQESEVVTFEVRMKRSVGRHRRARGVAAAAATADVEAGDEGRTSVANVDDVEVVEGGAVRSVGSDGAAHGAPITAQEVLSADALDAEEAAGRKMVERDEALEHVEHYLGVLDKCEEAARDVLKKEEQSTSYAQLLLSLVEREALARDAVEKEYEAALACLTSEKAAVEASICRDQMMAAVVDEVVNSEFSERAQLQHAEGEERAALHVEQLQLMEDHLRQLVEFDMTQSVEALAREHATIVAKLEAEESEAAARRLWEGLCEEEAQDREHLHRVENEEREALYDTVMVEKNSVTLTSAMKELCEAEGHERTAIVATEEEGYASLEIMKLIGDEMLLRQEIIAEAEHMLDSNEGIFNDQHKLLNALEMLQAVKGTERAERAKLVEEEVNARGNALLEAEEEEIALRRKEKMAENVCLVLGDEMARRDEIVADEEEDRVSLGRQQAASLVLQQSIVVLVESEEEARKSIGGTEGSEFGALQVETRKAAEEALTAQEEREVVEREVQQTQRRQDAQQLIKSVVFAYRIRRRLANRLLNRKVQEYKNAFADTLRMELCARSAIGDEERSERQQIDEAKNSLLSLTTESTVQTIAELETEEDDNRHQLIDDFMFHHSQLRRASRKVLAKEQESMPTLRHLQELEAKEDRIHSKMTSPIAQRFKLPLSDTGEDGEEEDEDEDVPLKTGKYKGYTLDSIGTFLLQYEQDLRRFKASLEKNRMAVAAEHDLLKRSRDSATQDMVHGGTEALWIPTRPLPLSDLVRGPSAQYRRGRILDARGKSSSSHTTDSDRRVTMLIDGSSFDGTVKQGRPF